MDGLLNHILLLDSIPDRAVELLASYIGPAVFLIVGALLTVVGLLVQEEKPAPPVPPKGYRPKPAQTAQRVNLLDTIHDARVPRWLRYGLIFMGLALLLVGIFWVVVLFTRQPGTGIVPPITPTMTPTYTQSPTITASYTQTPTATATPDIIPTVTPTSAPVPTETATSANIPTPTGTIPSPASTPSPTPQPTGLAAIAQAHLVSFVYSTNDHARLVMDLRTVLENGLAVSSGDKLTIHEIWYKAAGTAIDQSMRVEAYTSPGNYEAGQLQTHSWTTFREGTFNLLPDKEPFVWENISEEQKWLVIKLTRNDQAILDRYTIPLKPGTENGLAPISQAILWPFDRFTYIDFEAPGNADTWWPLGRNGIAQSSIQAFSGNSSLGVTIRSNSEQGWMEWDQAFTAEYLIGQVYWPERPGASIAWAQVCEPTSGGCVSIPTRMNEWNTFVIQFSQWKFKDKTMNQIEIPYLFFQGSINGIGDTPYTFYIDGIQLYLSYSNP